MLQTNDQKNKIVLLGTGTSTGVPVVGCTCQVCLSTHQKNKRLRCSVFIETKRGKKILIDTSPDLRYQILHYKLTAPDFVFITHSHADHVHGIDDLRPFSFKKSREATPTSIPIYVGDWIEEEMKSRFPYIFSRVIGDPILGGGIPLLKLHKIDFPLSSERSSDDGATYFEEVSFEIEEEHFTFLKLPHGKTHSLGIIHDKMAYIIDCSEIPRASLEYLKKQKLEVLIIDCLRRRPHETHLHLEKSLFYIKGIQSNFSGLTHLSDNFDHDDLIHELQDSYKVEENSVRPLYDGEELFYN